MLFHQLLLLIIHLVRYVVFGPGLLQWHIGFTFDMCGITISVLRIRLSSRTGRDHILLFACCEYDANVPFISDQSCECSHKTSGWFDLR